VSGVVPGLGVDPSEDARNLGRLVELVAHARGAEELLARLSHAGQIRPVPPVGRAIPAMVGAGFALEPGDWLFGTARDWPAALARGLSHEALLMQAFGKRHERTLPGAVFDRELGVSLTEGSHAGHVAEAVGFGVAAEQRGSGQIAVCCLGSGTLTLPETTAALVWAVETRARVAFVLRGPRASVERLVLMHRVPVAADSAHRVYWAVAEARTARPGLPMLIDARHGVDGQSEPTDARELQQRGLLSPELERALQAEVKSALDDARMNAERSGGEARARAGREA
jgi:TPP-dependent pyruvate/acetoin dehydrogenase alpha subunit